MNDIQQVIDLVRSRLPHVICRQLEVRHPGADDDGLWFFEDPGSDVRVQLESPQGNCPFLVEGGPRPVHGQTVAETADLVIRLFVAD